MCLAQVQQWFLDAIALAPDHPCPAEPQGRGQEAEHQPGATVPETAEADQEPSSPARIQAQNRRRAPQPTPRHPQLRLPHPIESLRDFTTGSGPQNAPRSEPRHVILGELDTEGTRSCARALTTLRLLEKAGRYSCSEATRRADDSRIANSLLAAPTCNTPLHLTGLRPAGERQ